MFGKQWKWLSSNTSRTKNKTELVYFISSLSRIISKPVLLNRHAKFSNLKIDYGENMHMKTSKFSELDFGENAYLKEPKLKLVFFFLGKS